MDLSELALAALGAVCFGGVAYAIAYPYLSGDAAAQKRQNAFVDVATHRQVVGRQIEVGQRKKQVAESLRELDARQKSKTKLTLEDRLSQAGLNWSRRKFFFISALSGVGCALLFLALTFEPLAALLGLLIGVFGLPQWVIGFLRKQRMNRFLEEFPNAMDVIVRGIKSGLPVGDCLRIIASESAEPVRTEFRQIVEAQTLGLTVPEACAMLVKRVPVSEANFFAIVMEIQSKAGGNLSEALGNLSKVIRARRQMKAKIVAMSMEAKASAAIIAALPFVVAILVYFSSPDYIKLLWTTTSGKIGIAVSGFWMICGVLVMRKMITFDI